MSLLCWDDLERSVARFARTPQGRSAARNGGLAPAHTIERANALLAQTECALHLNDSRLTFDGAREISAAIAFMRHTCRGDCQSTHLPGAVLLELASTCNAMRSAADAIAHTSEFEALVPRLRTVPKHTNEKITASFDSPRGLVNDSASELLAQTRSERRSEEATLRKELKAKSQHLASKRAAEQGMIVERRSRMCLPVKRGRQDLLPGCAVLEESARGNTLYVEPAEAITRNNRLLELSSLEEEEEREVLQSLTEGYASHVESIADALDAFVELDLALARAQHAQWLNASRPIVQSAPDQPINLLQVSNPLLLMQHLPPPESPVVNEGVTARMNHNGEVELRDILAQFETSKSRDEGEDEISEQNDLWGLRISMPPVPIDFTVPSGVSAVALTGPNTGGKTAALKTVGLITLMAKSGLYVPATYAELLFPESVGADIGDAQELEEGLSTFSGHLQRLKRLIDASSESSVLLVDEPGSGTDSAEGSSLACAVLEHLAAKCSLTVATSHYHEVKEVAVSNPHFASAAVELDSHSLAPRYELLWNRTGTSDAFQIAKRLGMPGSVLDQAQKAMPLLDASSLPLERARAEQEAAADIAADRALAAEEEHARLSTEIELEKERGEKENDRQELHYPTTDNEDEEAKKIERRAYDELEQCMDMHGLTHSEVQRRVDDIVSKARRDLGVDGADVPLDLEGSQDFDAGMLQASESGRYIPQIGDTVIVPRLGGVDAQVTNINSSSSPSRSGEREFEVDVRAGRLQARVAAGELKVRKRRAHEGQVGKGDGASVMQEFASAVSEDFLAVPSEANTVDVRGQDESSAAAHARAALETHDQSTALFIVHGKATGTLRNAVRREVERHPRVLQFRSGDDKEGGDGCTVVFLVSNDM